MTIAVHSLIKNSTESPVSFSLSSLPPFYCTGAFRGALLNGRGIRFGEWGGMWPWTCCRSGFWDRHTPSSRRLSLSSRKSHSSPGRNSYSRSSYYSSRNSTMCSSCGAPCTPRNSYRQHRYGIARCRARVCDSRFEKSYHYWTNFRVNGISRIRASKYFTPRLGLPLKI